MMLKLKPNQKIVFDGDSLTALRSNPTLDQWPWLRITNNHRSWADVTSELLFAWRPDLNLTFRTAAVGGSTCLGLEKRFDNTLAKIRPDWVLLTLGSNDASRDIPLEQFESVLRSYAERIGGWGGNVVFLYNMLPCPGAGNRNLIKHEKRGPYYKVEEKLAEEMDNVYLIDIGTPLKLKAELLHAQFEGHSVYSDGTHLSHLGAMVIAGEVLKAFGVVHSEQ